MSLAAASSSRNGEPDAKKFRYSMPAAQVAKHPLYDMNQNQGANRPNSNPPTEVDEKPQLNGSALGSTFDSAEPSLLFGQSSPQSKADSNEEDPANMSNFIKEEHRMESEGSAPESPANLGNRDSTESPVHDPLSAFLEQAANIFNANFKNLNKESSIPSSDSMPKLTPPPSQSHHQSMQASIPGALAVAASPAAQLFDTNDWSWHRNPAASIRSGGTNKQTPVWKYFVYNKAENLSRCIIGDCTYVLKGPHTSTLACHLKKHPAEYTEFQRLKNEYTRDRTTGTISSNGSVTGVQCNGRASSAASNGSSSSLTSHGTPLGCNNKQGSSAGLLQTSPPTNSAPTMVRTNPNVQPKSQNKKSQEHLNPLSSIFGGNPLLNNIAPNLGRSPVATGLKTPSSMNDLLNSLSARAVASLASQHNATSSSSHLPSHNSPINTPSLTPTSDQPMIPNPLHFMNFFKQNNGIFGQNTAAHVQNLDQKALVQQQTKKWPRHERKQRELETKLALALISLQIPLRKLQDPFLRDFLESAQPKFQLIPSGEPLEQILAQMHSRALTNMKTSLAAASKFTLMINAVPSDRQSESHPVCLCISVAYYSQTQQQVETILLGVRKVYASELPASIFQIVSKVLTAYDLNFEQVSRTILSGFEELDIQNDQLALPNQLRSYRHYLLEAMREIIDASELYAEIHAAVKRMIQSFCGYPETLMRLSRLCGSTLVAGLQQMPFEKLAQTLLEIRESFLAVCCQQPIDQFVSMISESQWAILDNILRLKRTFNAHMEIVQENAYATIDRVVPSIMQLLMTIGKDFPLLEPLPEQLTACIQQKLAFILDPQAEDFDSSFIQATALNPQLVVLLDEQQLSSAKSQIEKTLTERTRVNGEEPGNKRGGVKPNGGLDALLAAVVERKSNALNGAPVLPKAEDEPNESVNNSASSLYPDLVQAANQRRKQNKERTQNGKNHYIEAMIQAYFDDALSNSSCPSLFGSTNNTCPPLQSWQINASKCLQLSELAVELLSTPSSAIPPEFILNPPMEGGSTLLLDEYSTKHPFEFVKSGKDSPTLERDLIIRFNRSFWQKAQFP